MKLRTALIALAAAFTVCAWAQVPDWQSGVDEMIDRGEFAAAEKVMKSLPKKVRQADAVRIDSLMTIMTRIRKDFTITPEEGARLIREKMPEATDAQIENWKLNRKIEYMVIDGKEMWFRKSIRNLWLLGDEFKVKNEEEKEKTYATRRGYFLESMRSPADAQGVRDWRHVNLTFTLDVEPDVIPAGETLRVWMPIPFENLRQKNIRIEQCNRPYTLSTDSRHHTIYVEAVTEKGKPTHFEYTFSYDVAERHIAQGDLLAMLEPYDTQSEVYRRYTADEPRHVIITDEMRALARRIVGDETNPVLQASKIYNWISATYPWAGAREYSTLANIPEYVLLNNHGDCGQVALLYITLVRSLGIPARWESGWVVEPSGTGWHDWAETYFEGVGWVPTDQSYGRSSVGTPMETYYASGIDVYRLATNEAVGDVLSPRKTYIRSETVDFQAGEVEWRKGNIYYDRWHSDLKINSITKLP